MRTSKLLIVPVLFASLAPQMAQAETVVEFKFVEEELLTEQSRVELLDRLHTVSTKNCRTGSTYLAYRASKTCIVELKEQFLEAIGDEELTQMATGEEPLYRSASR